MIRNIVVSLAAVSMLLVPATHALAAPINSSTAQILPASCDDGNTYTVVINSGQSGNHVPMTASTWDPGFVIEGGAGHLIPTQFTFSGVDLSTGQTLFSQTTTKGNGQAGPNGTPLSCTIPIGTFPLPNGDTVQATLDVAGVLIGG